MHFYSKLQRKVHKYQIILNLIKKFNGIEEGDYEISNNKRAFIYIFLLLLMLFTPKIYEFEYEKPDIQVYKLNHQFLFPRASTE